ncbi:MAG: hypothetical protein AB8B71_11160 [Paracoccaceae bacterium]
MNLLKRLILCLFLGLSSVAIVMPATPAYAATTVQEVLDLIDIRISQLQAEQAAAQAVLASPTATPAQKIQAQADLQTAFFRIIQLTVLRTQVPGFPDNVLIALENFLRTEISAA